MSLKFTCCECGGHAELLPDGTLHCEYCSPTSKGNKTKEKE